MTMITAEQIISQRENAIKDFLTPFSFQLVTISLQFESGQPFVPFKSEHFNFTKAGKFTHAFTPEEITSPEIQKEILTLQQKTKCAVYFTVNEGNGVQDERGNCAKASNITELKTLVIDDDKNDLDAILNFLHRHQINPHAIINSSPNKHHIYILLEDAPLNDQNRLTWKACQKCLCHLGDPNSIPVTDSSMDDVTQVLRLPGFYHLKTAKPYQVLPRRLSNHPKYRLDDVFSRLNAESFYLHTDHLNGNSSHGPNGYSFEPFKMPTGYLQPGDRRPTCKRYIDSLLENSVKLEDHNLVDQALLGFVHQHVAPNYPDGSTRSDYLPDGKVWNNLMAYKQDAMRARRERKARAVALAATQTLEETTALHDQALPDDFFLNFPGSIGMLIREFHQAFDFVPMEMLFASSLMLSSYLKGHTYRFKGGWSMINGVVLGSSGAGKTTILNAIRTVLHHFDIDSKHSGYLQDPASAQVLHDHVYAAGGIGTLTLDESSGFLTKLSDVRSANYETAIRTYIKDSTISTNGKGTYITCSTSRSVEVEPITNGQVGYWFYTQPVYFEKLFSARDIEDGLLARFLIFKAVRTEAVDLTVSRESPTYAPSMSLITWAETILQKRTLFSRSSIRAFIETQVAAAPRAGQGAMTREEMRRAIAWAKDRLVEAKRFEVLNPDGFVDLKVSSRGKEMVDDYLSYVNSLNVEAVKHHSDIGLDDGSEAPECSLYMRQGEMLNRMIAVCADPGDELVADDIVEKCVEFSKFNLSRLMKKGGFEILTQSQEDRCEARLIQAIKAVMRRNKGNWVSVRDINLTLSGKFKAEFKDWKKVLWRMAQEKDPVVSMEIEHPKTKRKIIMYLVDEAGGAILEPKNQLEAEL